MPQGMRALSDLFVGFLPTIIFVSSLPDVIYFCYTPFPIWQCLLFASPLSEFMFCCAGIAFFFFFFVILVMGFRLGVFRFYQDGTAFVGVTRDNERRKGLHILPGMHSSGWISSRLSFFVRLWFRSHVGFYFLRFVLI